MEYIVFQISGGAGKNVMATAVIRAINIQYPEKKIVIYTGYPDIWVNNPRVHRVVAFGQSFHFYDDYIKDRSTILFAQEPYSTSDAIYKKKHLSEIWCDLCGVKWQGEAPELYFTVLERDFVQKMIAKSRPILLMQPFGGAQTGHSYSWVRDIPPSLAQRIADTFKEKYRVIQVKREDQPSLGGVDYLTSNFRVLSLATIFSDKRIFIDSFMQHAAAALNLPSTVFWIGNSPVVFGYDVHQNITAEFETGSTRNSLFDPYEISGGDFVQLLTSPHDLFNSEAVIDFLLKQEKEEESKLKNSFGEVIETPSGPIVPFIPENNFEEGPVSSSMEKKENVVPVAKIEKKKK